MEGEGKWLDKEGRGRVKWVGSGVVGLGLGTALSHQYS